MAEHAAQRGDMEAHRRTYEGFITASVVLTIMCAYVLVALVSFRFGQTWNVFLGFLGLALGILALLIDVRLGTRRYYLSVAILVLFALITAANVA